MANSRLVTVKAEQSVNRLVQDLYAIPSTGSRRMTQKAARALVEANPHIADLTTVPEGTPIVVPELPDLTFSASEAPAVPSMLDDLVQEVSGALRGVRTSLARSRDSTIQDAKDTLQVLQSSEFKGATGGQPVAERIASITAASNATIKAAEARIREHDAGLDELEAALHELLDRTHSHGELT